MRALSISLCCFQVLHLAAASLLSQRRSHGTVAERRAALKRAAYADWQIPELPEIPSEVPDMNVAGSPNVPVPLSAASPESVANVLDYEITMPTPKPAAFGGEFCRGGACQYRVERPPPLPPTPMPVLPPPLPVGGNMLTGRELCRGLTCIGGMGFPGNAKMALFVANCVRLYNDIAGGMVGQDDSRTMVQAYDSFMNVCKKRVGPLEVGACPGYANTIIGAEAPKVNSPTMGTAPEVCTDTYWFIGAFKQAEIDLKLTKAALPKGNSLLAIELNRFGSGGNGPSSPRGLKWREWVYKRHRFPQPPTVPQQLGTDGGFASAAFLQTGEDSEKPPPKPPIPGADSDDDTPRGLPKYKQNVPCGIKAKHNVPQSATKYQIAPGSPDGAVGPVEVDGDLFNYCANQYSEIMMGFAQTAPVIVTMTKDWCSWQASVSSWVGKQEEFGHPDWDHRTCANMQTFMAFVLKDSLSDTQTGLNAQQVCKKLFLTIGGVHRTEQIVDQAWVLQSTRSAPEGGGIPSGDDDTMKDMLAEAQKQANKIFSALRGQKSAYEELNTAKMDTAAFDPASVVQENPIPVAPDLPDSNDIDPNVALLALSVERVRLSRRVGVTMEVGLKAWGHVDTTSATL